MARRARPTGVRVSQRTKNIIREIRELSPRKYSSDDQLIFEQLAPMLEALQRRVGIPKSDNRPPAETPAPSPRRPGRFSLGATAAAHGAS